MKRPVGIIFLASAIAPVLALAAWPARAQDSADGMADMPGMDHVHPSPPQDTMPPAPAPITRTGPARAADRIWGAAAMAPSRHGLIHENGGMAFSWFQIDRLETRVRQGRDGYAWEAQGWYGGDINKLWFKSEGEGTYGSRPEKAEIQALYARAIGPWFNLQAGLRQDLVGPARTKAVVGVEGIAPYQFDVGARAFLSDHGDLTARMEADVDQRLAQRLILSPRIEANFSAQDVPAERLGGGLTDLELGLRLRYQIRREFAPYLGVSQSWQAGRTADFSRARGDKPRSTDFVAGVRLWF